MTNARASAGRFRCAAVFLCFLAASALVAQNAAPSAGSANKVELNVVEKTLKNGMRVLMVERHNAPTVALYMQFKVGAVNDPRGKTGIAHMLEHMMFKGTQTLATTNYKAEVPLMEKIDRAYAELEKERQKEGSAFEQPDKAKIEQLEKQMVTAQEEQKKYIVSEELSQLYQRIGGVGLNASTGDDSTQYFLSLPANQLEVWATIESDRIANPVFREFYSERDVVHEERRLRTDTQPTGLLWENFRATAFQAHPYHNPPIGWPSDIDSLKREEVLQYFKTFYAPNNWILAIVGDIDPNKTIALLEKYFGPIPPQPQPRRYITEEPEQRGERRVVVSFEAQPQVYIGYHIPQVGQEDTYALDVLSDVLTGVTRGSRTGRLYKSLVVDKKVALSADAGADISLYPSLFIVTATPAQGKTIAEVEKAIYEEIDKIQTEPPTAEEMARIRNGVDADMIRGLRGNMGVARMIAYVEHVAGTWRFIYTERDKTKAVTPEQVQAVAKKYLSADNRTVAEIRPPQSGEEGGEQEMPAAPAYREVRQ